MQITHDLIERIQHARCQNCKKFSGLLATYCSYCGKALSLPKNLDDFVTQENWKHKEAPFLHDHKREKDEGRNYCSQCGEKLLEV